jgi:hypothetical protein
LRCTASDSCWGRYLLICLFFKIYKNISGGKCFYFHCTHKYIIIHIKSVFTTALLCFP